MNLENVRYLLTALDTGSFSAAAAHFNLTPSGLNRQISALERELGTVLLLRSRRGVLPAQGAEPIITRLRDVVAAEERGQEEITAAKGLITGHLSIGFYYSIAANFLPPLLKTFSSTYPAIRLSVTKAPIPNSLKHCRRENWIVLFYHSTPMTATFSRSLTRNSSSGCRPIIR